MRSVVAVLFTAFALVGGCQGLIEEPGSYRPGTAGAPDPLAPIVCDGTALRPGRAPIRRLTVTEYDNSIRDLFGDSSGPAGRLVDNERGELSADARSISTLLAEQYMFAAEDVAARLTDAAAVDGTLGCDRAAVGDDDCAAEFIDRVAPQVYRRPLEAGESAALYALYEAGRDDGGFEVGIQLVVELMLQSPSFLYRVEIVPTDGEEVVRLDGHQLATRLSYFFWSTTPDEALLSAATAGALETDAGVEAEVRRLLADPRAEDVMQAFFARLLEFERLDGLEKDPELFPDFGAETPELFRAETEAFVREVLVEGDGSWVTLMTAPWSMMNADLAAYYGLSGPTGEAFERVDLDSAYHSGLLTHGSSTATRARLYETSPVHRGMFVRGNIMCGHIPDLPEGLEVVLPEPDDTLTTRERFARHREDPVCGGCHSQLDPLGFAYEHFDAAGRFRPTENGLPIDASGVLTESDNAGDFESIVDLADRLVESEETQGCFARRWFPQAFGRASVFEDACALEQILEQFRGEDFDIRELLVAVALSETFLHRVADQDTLRSEVTP